MRKNIIILLILLAPLAVGSGHINTVTEDFESYTAGAVDPAPDYATWDAPGYVITADNNALGAPGGAQTARIERVSGSIARYIIEPDRRTAATVFEQYIYYSAAAGNEVNMPIEDNLGNRLLDVRQDAGAAPNVDTSWAGASTITAGSCAAPLHYQVSNINYVSNTFDIVIDDKNGATCYSAAGRPFNDPDYSGHHATLYAFPTGAVYVDNIKTQVQRPLLPPEGLRGTVYQIDGATTRLFIEVATSPDDTDPTAEFEYTLERDDGLGGGFSPVSTLAAGTAVGGVFGVQDSYSGASDTLTYRAITESGPDYSCTITISPLSVNNQDVCGTLGETVIEGGALFGDAGVFFFGDKDGVAETLKLSVAGLEALYGVIMVMLLMSAGYAAIKIPEKLMARKEREEFAEL